MARLMRCNKRLHALYRDHQHVTRWGTYSDDDGLFEAAKSNNGLMMLYFMGGVFISWYHHQIFYGACAGGHLRLLKKCVANGSRDYYEGLRRACKHGQVDVARYFVSMGANNFGTALVCASRTGHLTMVKYCVEELHETNASSMTGAVEQACLMGHLRVVKYLVETGHDMDCENMRWMARRTMNREIKQELQEYLDEAFREMRGGGE
jgi:hypothetical protein